MRSVMGFRLPVDPIGIPRACGMHELRCGRRASWPDRAVSRPGCPAREALGVSLPMNGASPVSNSVEHWLFRTFDPAGEVGDCWIRDAFRGVGADSRFARLAPCHCARSFCPAPDETARVARGLSPRLAAPQLARRAWTRLRRPALRPPLLAPWPARRGGMAFGADHPASVRTTADVELRGALRLASRRGDDHVIGGARPGSAPCPLRGSSQDPPPASRDRRGSQPAGAHGLDRRCSYRSDPSQPVRKSPPIRSHGPTSPAGSRLRQTQNCTPKHTVNRRGSNFSTLHSGQHRSASMSKRSFCTRRS